MHTLSRLAALSLLVLTTSALAQAPKPKPRVLVILDTSRSMMEYPVFANPSDADIIVPLTDPGGDYNQSLDNNCTSKFCMAKKAVNNVLPVFASDARIGLATYYQYIIKAESTNTQNTACMYDVLSAPDVRKRFTSPIDYTGSGMTFCSGGTALSPDTTCTPGTTRTAQPFFPDTSQGGAQVGLNGFCPTPPGVTSPHPSATAIPSPCTTDTRNCYVLTKTNAVPNGNFDCPIFADPASSSSNSFPSLPTSFTSIANNGSGCLNATLYDSVASATVYNPAMPIEQIVSLSNTSCPVPVAPTAAPTAPASVTVTSNQTVGNAVGDWRNFFGPGQNCTSQTRCGFYSLSGTPVERFSNASWYGFFNNTFTPTASAATTAAGGYNFTQYNTGPGAAYVVPTASGITGSVNYASTASMCVGGPVGTVSRVTSGSLSAYGMPNARTDADSSAVSRGARADHTPNQSGNTVTCSPEYPCDVRLAADVVVAGAWSTNGNIYANVGIGANQRTTPLANDTWTLRLLGGAMSCPAVGTGGAAPAGSAWNGGSPGGCTGTGQGACTFTYQSTGTVSTTSCPSVDTWSTSASAPGNCVWNNTPPTGPVNQPSVPVTRLIAPASSGSCSTGNFDIAAAGSYTLGGACGSFPCRLSYVNETAGVQSSSWGLNIYQRTANPSGYPSGNATRSQVITTVEGPRTSATSPSCLGGTNTYITQSGALCPGGTGTCSLYVLGPQQVSTTGCGAESGPCYACVYEQQRFQWDRPTTTCNYTATARRYSYNQNATSCVYTRPRWLLETQAPDTRRCDYQVGVRRYDFAPPQEKVCQYWAVQSTLRSTRAIYTYEYKTKGTELIGRASKTTSGSALCGSNSAVAFSGALSAACPETATCSSLGPLAMLTTGPLGTGSSAPAGSTCKLHWGGGGSGPTLTNRVFAYSPYPSANGSVCGSGRCASGDTCNSSLCHTNGARRGRAGYAGSATLSFDNNPTNTTSGRLCEEAASPPASASAYQVAEPSNSDVPGFCSNSGIPSGTTYHLVSDYYAPATANLLTTYTSAACTPINPTAGPPPQPGKPCFRTAGASPPYTSVEWTQGNGPPVFNTSTPNKLQGFGGRTGVTTGPTGVVPPTSVFVPIPDESVYDENAQRTALKAATTLCVMPSADVSPSDGLQDGPNGDGSLRGGACVSDFADKSATNADFTPLYGSLKNANDYLRDRWSTDDAPDCRDYFILLATDGVENTPAGYTLTGADPNTAVEGLVGSFRNTSPVTPRTRPDIRTFVIGFGQGAAGAGVAALNAVAAAGGTTNAYFPSTLSDLQNALNAVFTSITTGVFSRSKPAIGTDGTRIYAAQFIRPATGADWYGQFSAYGVDPTTGTPLVVWEHHTKLDDPSHPARNIRAVMRHNDHTHADLWATGMGFRDSPIDTRWDFNGSLPDGGTPTVNSIIRFMRDRNEPYDRLLGGAVQRRSSAVAPIVASSPVVVGKSPFDDMYGGTTASARASFRTFVTNTETRPTRVYFSSNDGMVHAIRENAGGAACATESSMSCPNGREDWAVLPLMLPLGNVPTRGQPTLGESLFKIKSTGSWSMNLLNGTVAVADVCNEDSDFDGDAANCSSNRWKTILIATQREGGRGMVAIDITDPTNPPSGSSNGSNNRILWDFFDSNLGFTYSTPAIGRVRYADEDKFVAVFGGGLDDPDTGTVEGQRAYVLDALWRDEGNSNRPRVVLDTFKFDRGAIPNNNFTDQLIARPASYRRPAGTYMDSAYLAAGKTLYAMRFANPGGTQWNDRSRWTPDELFDPTSLRNNTQATSAASSAPVNRIVETYAGNPADPSDPPRYALEADGTLPLVTAPSILNRPKLGNVLATSGGKPDLFVGTGDIVDPQSPRPEFQNANYFYAIHDFNDQLHSTLNDGRALWVAKFCGGQALPGTCLLRKEQVVSEPALISSCVIVATYTPPLGTSACSLSGDTILYGFNAITGALAPCLVFPAGSPWSGQTTSVLKMPGVGIPSDLVVINDNLYFTTSNQPGVSQVTVRQNPRPGAVRSYRRLK